MKKTRRIDRRQSLTEKALTLGSVLDLPFVHEHALDAQKVLDISGLNRLGDLSAKNVAVVDTLRTLIYSTPESFFDLDDVAVALGTSLRQAASARHAVWLSALTPEELRAAMSILGEDLIERVGVGEDADGSRDGRIPVAVSPLHLMERWSQGSPKQQQALKELLHGADTLIMQRRALAAARRVGTRLIERNRIRRILYNPKVVAYLIVFIYSSLRALPVILVPGFHGKVWILWSIDITTAIPYTWGIIEMFAGRTILRRMVGLVITIVTFMSPYVYFWMNGRGYPLWVNIVVGLLIVGAIAVEFLRWCRDRYVDYRFSHLPKQPA
ncbi:hypothetical protein L1O03_06400 [Corynebacterium uropygiale]|uniref:Uncharacterized protein n=1 Tax=Corynebacterium uropygiale TaxID=1775911 RepID=A0A9X1QTM6_9CORY|nr:hypothetical protein [Corynebacterium uropygiale]